MHKSAFLIHALSPLHAGTGHSSDLVDLPTARMKGTQIPYVPGSSIKGVLRHERLEAAGIDDRAKADALTVFGPETANAGDHAGAIIVGDARLLALPVRSFTGTFAWVTSPLLLRLAARDLDWRLPLPSLPPRGARVTSTSCCLHEKVLYLEDLDLPAQADDKTVKPWAEKLAPHIYPDAHDLFRDRLAVVDDETMSFLMETATQIDARVRLKAETRTVADGALWLEESLPSETLLVGLLVADKGRNPKHPLTAEAVLRLALGAEATLQLGGKASVGRGRCRVIPLSTPAKASA